MPTASDKFKLTQSGAQVQSDLNLTENLQEAFSTSSTYAVGDLCIYDSKIWRCHTAVSTASAWTGTTNWTQIHLSDISGGAVHLYRHYVELYCLLQNGGDGTFYSGDVYIEIITNSSTQFTSINQILPFLPISAAGSIDTPGPNPIGRGPVSRVSYGEEDGLGFLVIEICPFAGTNIGLLADQVIIYAEYFDDEEDGIVISKDTITQII